MMKRCQQFKERRKPIIAHNDPEQSIPRVVDGIIVGAEPVEVFIA